MGFLTALWMLGCSEDPAPDAAVPDAGQSDALPVDVGFVVPEAGVTDSGVLPHDAGGPMSCTASCDCTQGLACVGGACRAVGTPVFCCDKPGCPAGATCLDPMDRPNTCAPPDAGVPDSGQPDLGPSPLSGPCTSNDNCQAGLTCLTQMEVGFLWDGYCTVRDCELSPCPTGSQCLFYTQAQDTACFATCTVDADCRPDHHCLPLQGAPFSICYPDCRDDLFDCAPRDSTVFCNRSSGRCEPTPTHNNQARVGSACGDTRDCALGDVCISELLQYTSGMCTRVCEGLAEAIPCSADQTCQDLLGIGLCYENCSGNACPNRADAVCGTYPTWTIPGCIPQ